MNTADLKRDQIIDEDYPLLRNDLQKLIPDRSVPVVLIKANVCRRLKPKLEQDGFTVINGEVIIPFPSHDQQKKFAEKVQRRPETCAQGRFVSRTRCTRKCAPEGRPSNSARNFGWPRALNLHAPT